ncbi:hypothetical protein [Jongsikchunia kroppenstedtii]|uniref:hypothetical protein n=1 Tax=Jongsikchunia kroppenstedtii TaxID=1121721 RepID=UPI000363E667|nr:hypothetical protein [Jongsikchunia kroppenstedtii]
MTTTFGPQLIGETEKTLNAVLLRVLEGTGLTEPQWVTLRIASQNETGAELVELVADRAHFPEAAHLVADLTTRDLLDGQGLSAAGRELITGLQQRIGESALPIFDGLDAGDVAATERVLNRLIDRGREALATAT